MSNPFFEHPILNSPYEYPTRHWELDEQGQPTQRIVERRRPAQFIAPISKARKQKGTPPAPATQARMVFDDGKGFSTDSQQYDTASMINEVRHHVDQWRDLPCPSPRSRSPFTLLSSGPIPRIAISTDSPPQPRGLVRPHFLLEPLRLPARPGIPRGPQDHRCQQHQIWLIFQRRQLGTPFSLPNGSTSRQPFYPSNLSPRPPSPRHPISTLP